ncbi:hypothetical protein PHYPSEUDO_003257 [Phytophthora pseudosyringae]|uniref:Uncharacterized protein n=1 Tax=Phytophthora pseudosyringae TaxID=221518 RepID=A0A8T1VRI0_9STRA|nr:hypothetical protein PHYPSEUDO_003257 [Phytophthora pseudosyringae]
MHAAAAFKVELSDQAAVLAQDTAGSRRCGGLERLLMAANSCRRLPKSTIRAGKLHQPARASTWDSILVCRGKARQRALRRDAGRRDFQRRGFGAKSCRCRLPPPLPLGFAGLSPFPTQ